MHVPVTYSDKAEVQFLFLCEGNCEGGGGLLQNRGTNIFSYSLYYNKVCNPNPETAGFLMNNKKSTI